MPVILVDSNMHLSGIGSTIFCGSLLVTQSQGHLTGACFHIHWKAHIHWYISVDDENKKMLPGDKWTTLKSGEVQLGAIHRICQWCGFRMKKSSYDYEEANMETKTRYFPTNLCWQEFVSEDVQHIFKSSAKCRFCHIYCAQFVGIEAIFGHILCWFTVFYIIGKYMFVNIIILLF